jgi:uncharacterized protein YceK
MKNLIVIVLVLLTSGCASNGQSILGKSTTATPGWDRLKQAAKTAVNDPHVWAPVVAAAALQVNDLDHEISDQAREHTPLFGSNADADEMSDKFRDFTEVVQLSTLFLAEGPDEPGDWMWAKSKLLLAQHVAIKSTSRITSNLKSTIGRERPNMRNKKSMPSGHTSKATIQASMAQINIEHLAASDTTKRILDLSMTGSAALTGWARVEAGAHYPSDVLIGYSLGRFIGHIAEAFIVPDKEFISIVPVITDDTTSVTLMFNF